MTKKTPANLPILIITVNFINVILCNFNVNFIILVLVYIKSVMPVLINKPLHLFHPRRFRHMFLPLQQLVPTIADS